MSPVQFNDEQVEIMARAAHAFFCKGLISQGYQYGPEINDELKTHPSLMEYDRLPEELKEANRATVCDIPGKLNQLGYRIEASGKQEGLLNFTETELDRLAQLEHQRWMNHRLEGGWTYGPKTDPDRKIHASLVIWDKLPEEEREKDREMVRSIPKILAEAEFVMVAA